MSITEQARDHQPTQPLRRGSPRGRGINSKIRTRVSRLAAGGVRDPTAGFLTSETRRSPLFPVCKNALQQSSTVSVRIRSVTTRMVSMTSIRPVSAKM